MPKLSVEEKFVQIPDTPYLVGCDNYGWIIRQQVKTKDSQGNETGNTRNIDRFLGTFSGCLTRLSELCIMKATNESKVIYELFEKWEKSYLVLLEKVKELAPAFYNLSRVGKIVETFEDEKPIKSIPKTPDIKIAALLTKFEEE